MSESGGNFTFGGELIVMAGIAAALDLIACLWPASMQGGSMLILVAIVIQAMIASRIALLFFKRKSKKAS